jgi:recombination DNA repair RAD52 pathway protein
MSEEVTFGDVIPPAGLDQLQLEALMLPLHVSRVKHRSQGGRDLSYVEAHDVRSMLIRIFGFGGFSIETVEARPVTLDRRNPDGTGHHVVTAMAHVRLIIPSLEAVYSEVAAATQTGPVLGDVLDFALKTAVSDATKRCAVNLGTQFGLSLYNDGSLDECVRVIFEPEQRAMLTAIRDARENQPPAPMPSNVRTLVDRATGSDSAR